MTITIVLLCYAALVAVLAPRVLDAGWVRRSPWLALSLWHASALSVLAAAVTAALSCPTADLIETCVAALSGSAGAAGVLTVAAGLLIPGLLLARLAIVAVRTIRAARECRRRHLELLGMLGRPQRDLGVTVIPGTIAAAYCVPGTDRIVLTQVALDSLDPAALDAVLAHERAHLTGHHQLLVTWADVLARAFPVVPVLAGLRRATRELVEFLADDDAVRRGGRSGLADAIAAFAAPGGVGFADGAGLAISGGPVIVRVQRLLDPPPRLSLAARLGCTGAAAVLVALPGLLAVVSAGVAACPLLFG